MQTGASRLLSALGVNVSGCSGRTCCMRARPILTHAATPASKGIACNACGQDWDKACRARLKRRGLPRPAQRRVRPRSCALPPPAPPPRGRRSSRTGARRCVRPTRARSPLPPPPAAPLPFSPPVPHQHGLSTGSACTRAARASGRTRSHTPRALPQTLGLPRPDRPCCARRKGRATHNDDVGAPCRQEEGELAADARGRAADEHQRAVEHDLYGGAHAISHQRRGSPGAPVAWRGEGGGTARRCRKAL